MKQTAIEFLISKIESNSNPSLTQKELKESIEQAKKMEKEQIENAWYAGDKDGAIHEFEYYYNNTFKNK